MSECKKCGLEIVWKREGTRWLCYNLDGTEHWDLCSKVRTEKQIATGKFFRDQYGEGYVTAERKMYTLKIAKSKNRVEVCFCATPPWELCEHSFEWARQ
jgi:hypothetical protein